MVAPVLYTVDHRSAAGESSGSSGVDSRQYTFSFSINSLSAMPADFGDVPGVSGIRAGAFLPRGEPNHLGIHPYSARVLLVTDSELIVMPHPSEHEAPLRVPIREIEGFEWGQMLLLGWIRFFWCGGSTVLRYNRRSSHPIEEAIQEIEGARHSPRLREPATRLKSFGEPLNLKFECARSARLLTGEEPSAQLFYPARCQMRWCWGLRRQIWSPGSLLLATPTRLLWITEDYEGGYTPYGSVTHSADRSSITSVEAPSPERHESEPVITFHSRRRWRLPVRQESEGEFWAFIQTLRQLLQR